MSRPSRNNMKTSSFFHIMVQGINKEYVFRTQKNKERYLQLICTNNKDIQIIAFCIMDNHVHILVQTNKIQNLQEWMRKSNTSYAMYYNKLNDRVGYVFRERYKAQPIKNEKHLYLAMEYIHNNPIKAEICNKQEDYEFSSYVKIYQGNKQQMQKKLENIINQCISQLENKEEGFNLLENDKEDRDKICKKVINVFLEDKNLNIEKLKKDKQNLTQIIKILKYENNISYRLMEKNLKISREKLRGLIIK